MILANQPHRLTTMRQRKVHDRRLKEKATGFHAARNSQLKESNALGAFNSPFPIDRISPPDKMHANVPPRINHATMLRACCLYI